MNRTIWLAGMVVAALLAAGGCDKSEPEASKPIEEEDVKNPVAPGPRAAGTQDESYLGALITSADMGKQTASKMTLRGLGQAVQMAQATGQDLPDDLEGFARLAGKSPSAMVSPADKRTRLRYIPPDGEPGAGTVLLYDPAVYPGDTMNVLMGNGAVREMTPQQLADALRAQGVEHWQD